ITCHDFDAVVVATGDFNSEMDSWGIDHNEKQILSDKKTHQTNIPNVFAIGNVNRSTKYAVRSVGQGKEVAFSIEQFLQGEHVTGEPRLFNSRFGKLVEEEFTEYLKESPLGKISDKQNRLLHFHWMKCKKKLQSVCIAIAVNPMNVFFASYRTNTMRIKTGLTMNSESRLKNTPSMNG
ncbi:MAG: hypothetical protein HC906_13255, partial [Bacteroidales bacterium]|nr:hypothetical protein [Bacteroidales bacterium]